MNYDTIIAMGAGKSADMTLSAAKDRAQASKETASDFKKMMKKATEAQKSGELSKPDSTKPETEKPLNGDENGAKKDAAEDAPKGEIKTKTEGAEVQAAIPQLTIMDQTIQMMMARVVQNTGMEEQGASGISADALETAVPQLPVSEDPVKETGKETVQVQNQSGAMLKPEGDSAVKKQGDVQNGQGCAVKTAEKSDLTVKGNLANQETSTEGGPETKTVKTAEPSAAKEETLVHVDTATVAKMSEPAEETVKIKVGDGALNTQSEQFPKELAKTIQHHMENGRNEFDIQLAPKELGEIHIKLVFEAGSASVLMNCTNTKTQELLSLNAEQIRSIVQEQTGLNTTVQVKEQSGFGASRQDLDGGNDNPQREAQKEAQTQEQERQRLELENALYSQQFRMEFLNAATDHMAS